MQNAAAVEALYSATFVEDYLDCVENLPNDLQRHLSRLREFDLTQYSEFLRDLDGLVSAFENEKSAAGQWQVLAKIQLGLIAAQDIGDEKMATAQALNDLIEDKTRLLKHDAGNLDFGDDSDEAEDVGGGKGLSSKPAGSTTPRPEGPSQSNAAGSNAAAGGGTTKTPSSSTKNKAKPSTEDKASSARKRTKEKNKGGKGGEHDSDHPQDNKKHKGETGPSKSGGGSTKKKPGSSRGKGQAQGAAGPKGGASGAKEKGGGLGERPARAAAAAAAAAATCTPSHATLHDADSDPEIPPFDFDPDEPTYCLCEQVSFGEMVACDNDLCPYEWFHFDCVQLSSKPKGKWYCPKCRGDKPSVMKPKAVFLKELDKYNKEKEERNAKK